MCARAEQKLSRFREREMCARAEQKLSRFREREREMCVRAEQKLSRFRERERCVRVLNRNWADSEREMCAHAEQKLSRCGERDVCARARKARPRSTGDSLRLNKVWALFGGGESLKGSAMLLSWQHCASPFLRFNYRLGHGSNRKYALR